MRTVCTVYDHPARQYWRSNEKAAAKFAAALSSCGTDYAISDGCRGCFLLGYYVAERHSFRALGSRGLPVTNSCYSALRDAAQGLSQAGLRLQTVIPTALPAEKHPLTRKNKKTGEWEVQYDQDGQPRPAFVGKNPSYWRADGEPRLASQRQSLTCAELLDRIAIAERLNRPIGLAVIPGGDVVSIDFDTKNYKSLQELEQDWMRLVDRYPVLTETRMERTPSGGLHIYVRVADWMASWQRPGGGLHCNFTTAQGGQHRGEVLAGTRVSVCAPTCNGTGKYELINPEAAYCFVEVPDLAAIGIYPEVKAVPAPAEPPPSLPSPPASSRRAPAGASIILITQMTPRMARRGRRVVHKYHSSHGSQCHSVPEGALRARVPGALRDGSPV